MIYKKMKLDDKEFKKLFNSKERLDCAMCGANDFRFKESGIPNASIKEVIIMICKKCNHPRVELI